jgi:putative protease
LRVSITTKEQLETLCHSTVSVDRIYIPADLFYLKEVNYKDIIEQKKKTVTGFYLSLPRVIRKRDEEYLRFVEQISESFDGILIKNIEGLCFLQTIGYQGVIVTDSSVYNWNRQALKYLNCFRNEYTYSLELTLHENMDLHDFEGEYIIYGRTPMMVSANCVRKTTDTCTHNINGFEQSLTDRYRKELPVFANCVHCYNEIFNAVNMSCHKELPQLIKNRFYKFRLNFTNENADKTLQIVNYYNNLLYHPQAEKEFPLKEYTTGHFKEGAL